jgi:hypothetical protein
VALNTTYLVSTSYFGKSAIAFVLSVTTLSVLSIAVFSGSGIGSEIGTFASSFGSIYGNYSFFSSCLAAFLSYFLAPFFPA